MGVPEDAKGGERAQRAAAALEARRFHRNPETHGRT